MGGRGAAEGRAAQGGMGMGVEGGKGGREGSMWALVGGARGN